MHIIVACSSRNRFPRHISALGLLPAGNRGDVLLGVHELKQQLAAELRACGGQGMLGGQVIYCLRALNATVKSDLLAGRCSSSAAASETCQGACTHACMRDDARARCGRTRTNPKPAELD